MNGCEVTHQIDRCSSYSVFKKSGKVSTQGPLGPPCLNCDHFSPENAIFVSVLVSDGLYYYTMFTYGMKTLFPIY